MKRAEKQLKWCGSSSSRTLKMASASTINQNHESDWTGWSLSQLKQPKLSIQQSIACTIRAEALLTAVWICSELSSGRPVLPGLSQLGLVLELHTAGRLSLNMMTVGVITAHWASAHTTINNRTLTVLFLSSLDNVQYDFHSSLQPNPRRMQVITEATQSRQFNKLSSSGATALSHTVNKSINTDLINWQQN